MSPVQKIAAWNVTTEPKEKEALSHLEKLWLSSPLKTRAPILRVCRAYEVRKRNRPPLITRIDELLHQSP